MAQLLEKRIVILHAGIAVGLLPGCLLSAKKSSADYHQYVNAELFEKWFQHLNLLPSIPTEREAIVMNSSSYHSCLTIRPPNRNTRKAIISFMEENNVPLPFPVPRKDVYLDAI